MTRHDNREFWDFSEDNLTSGKHTLRLFPSLTGSNISKTNRYWTLITQQHISSVVHSTERERQDLPDDSIRAESEKTPWALESETKNVIEWKLATGSGQTPLDSTRVNWRSNCGEVTVYGRRARKDPVSDARSRFISRVFLARLSDGGECLSSSAPDTRVLMIGL